MKKLLLIATATVLLFGCKPSQKETIKKLKDKVKKEDVCNLLKVTAEIVRTFYPNSKVILVSEVVKNIGCKELTK